jgi:hypothetical protein
MALKKRSKTGEFYLWPRREGISTFWLWWVWVKA